METAELSTDLVGPRPDIAGIDERSAQADALTIRNNEDYLQACEIEKGLRALDKAIIDGHAQRKQLAHKLHKLIVEEEKEQRRPVLLALDVIRPKRIAWEQEQERLRREEEKRQRDLQAKEDEERRLKEALAAEEKGDTRKAEKILEREEPIAKVSVVSSLPKSGIAKRTYWDFEEVSLKDLVKAAAEDDRWLPFLDFHRVRIRQQVNSLKDMCRIPGIKVTQERR